MKTIIVSMIVAVYLMAAGGAMAADVPDNIKIVMKNNGFICNACHRLDTKLVGPAWIDIAKKYKGDKDAEAKLMVKVSKGGSGVWGSVPMTPNDSSGTKQAGVKELVKFILGLAK